MDIIAQGGGMKRKPRESTTKSEEEKNKKTKQKNDVSLRLTASHSRGLQNSPAVHGSCTCERERERERVIPPVPNALLRSQMAFSIPAPTATAPQEPETLQISKARGGRKTQYPKRPTSSAMTQSA